MQLLHILVELLHMSHEGIYLRRRGHAKPGQCLGNPVFENSLQLVCAVGHVNLNTAGYCIEAAVGFGDFFFGCCLCLALQGEAFLDQGFEYLAALLLRFGKGPQASQPYLLSGVLDRAGQWRFA